MPKRKKPSKKVSRRRMRAIRDRKVEAILSNPTATNIEVVKFLARVYRIKATPGAIAVLRTELRSEGIDLPALPPGPSKAKRTRDIEEVIKANPDAYPEQHAALLKKKGITASVSDVRYLRGRLRRAGEPIAILTPRHGKPLPKLTPKQEHLRRRVANQVRGLAYSQARERKLRKSTTEDLLAYIGEQLFHWVANPNTAKHSEGEFRGFLTYKVPLAVSDFIRAEVSKELGIPQTDVRILFSLLDDIGKEKHEGLDRDSALRRVARRRKVPLKKARELVAAYELNKRRVPLDLERH